MNYNTHFIRSILKNKNMTGLDAFDVDTAAKIATFFDLFMEYTDALEFPIEDESGEISSEYPSHDARCISAAILAAASLITRK